MWFISIISGFAYVNKVSVGREFRKCLQSRHDRYFDIIVVILYSIPVFTITSNLVLISDHDLKFEYCQKSECSLYNEKGEFIDNDFNWDVICTNFIYFCMPFTLILNYYHIRKIEFCKKIIINTQIMKTWRLAEWSFFFFILNLFLLFMTKMFYDHFFYFGVNVFLCYILFMIASVVIIITICYYLRDTHFLHLHHYFITMLTLPYISVQNKINLVFLGLSTGLLVEGSAKWGIDAVWTRHHKNE